MEEKSKMTPNNHPPFDAPGNFCNDETMEKAWQYVEETKANGYVFHSETEAVVAFEIGMFHQYKKDLRTMIPREKVEKLVSTVEHSLDFLEGYSHSPGVTLCLEHLRMRIEEFNHPDGKDENGGT